MIIKDVVHRFVEVPYLCEKFMDTPEFNRLRRIKQLGLSHFVYPSATHTRFEHCIGVMHLAGKFADKLGIVGRDKELLQFAGLFHDSGHVAFSHLMDYILEEKKFSSNIANHESRSILLIRRINDRLHLLSEEDMGKIARMIRGDNHDTNTPYLFEIISNHNFGVDVDRLDYLQRDLYHTGMTCFQADYIIEGARINSQKHLCFLRKTETEIEMMFEARRRLLLLVCRHKTVVKAEHLIREAIQKLDFTEEWFRENWTKLDDGRIQCMMEDKCPEILEKIYTRNWPEISDESRYTYLSLVQKEEIQEQMEKIQFFL